MFEKAVAHLRYFLGGHRPSETSILTQLQLKFSYYLNSNAVIGGTVKPATK